MYSPNEGLIVVGIVIAIWGVLAYFGITISHQVIIDKFSKKFIILDEKALIRHDFIFRVLLSASAVAIGFFQQAHGKLPITIILLILAFSLILAWERIRRKKFLKPKEKNSTTNKLPPS